MIQGLGFRVCFLVSYSDFCISIERNACTLIQPGRMPVCNYYFLLVKQPCIRFREHPIKPFSIAASQLWRIRPRAVEKVYEKACLMTNIAHVGHCITYIIQDCHGDTMQNEAYTTPYSLIPATPTQGLQADLGLFHTTVFARLSPPHGVLYMALWASASLVIEPNIIIILQAHSKFSLSVCTMLKHDLSYAEAYTQGLRCMTMHLQAHVGQTCWLGHALGQACLIA